MAFVAIAPSCKAPDGGGGTTTTAAPTTETPTTAPTTAAPTTAPPVDPALALCVGAELAVPPPVVANATLNEISGLAASRTHDGVLWAHNDSGGAASVYGIGTDGADLGTWTLTGATNRDWEDMAIGPGPDPEADSLYLADIGDNLQARADIVIYRVPEPDPSAGSAAMASPDKLTITYPDGAHDAEALLVDPLTGDLIIVDKEWSGGPTLVYRAPGDLAAGSTTVLESVGYLDLGPYGQLATGGDISVDGSVVALRTYSHVLFWWRQPGATVAETLQSSAPCEAPVANEAQGETVALLPAGDGYVTISEGVNPPLNRYLDS